MFGNFFRYMNGRPDNRKAPLSAAIIFTIFFALFFVIGMFNGDVWAAIADNTVLVIIVAVILLILWIFGLSGENNYDTPANNDRSKLR